jgi:hypothetical protein
MLEEWRAGLPEAERGAFDQLSVADLLAGPPASHLGKPYCATLPPAAQHVIAAGTTLIARKRP